VTVLLGVTVVLGVSQSRRNKMSATPLLVRFLIEGSRIYMIAVNNIIFCTVTLY